MKFPPIFKENEKVRKTRVVGDLLCVGPYGPRCFLGCWGVWVTSRRPRKSVKVGTMFCVYLHMCVCQPRNPWYSTDVQKRLTWNRLWHCTGESFKGTYGWKVTPERLRLRGSGPPVWGSPQQAVHLELSLVLKNLELTIQELRNASLMAIIDRKSVV